MHQQIVILFIAEIRETVYKDTDTIRNQHIVTPVTNPVFQQLVSRANEQIKQTRKTKRHNGRLQFTS